MRNTILPLLSAAAFCLFVAVSPLFVQAQTTDASKSLPHAVVVLTANIGNMQTELNLVWEHLLPVLK